MAASPSDATGTGRPEAPAPPAADANGRFVPPPPPPAPQEARGSELPPQLGRGARWTGRQLLRPRVRTGLIGALLVVIGLAAVDGTWSTLLTVAGVVLLLVAYIGSRMKGRLLVEWGEEGTKLEFDAGVKPAPEPMQTVPMPTRSRPAGLAAAPAPAPEAAIEGEAHTVEIDVDELRALIAAAERSQAA